MELLGDEGENSTAAEDTDKFLVVQVAAINALLSKALCQQCSQLGLTVVPGTRHGLAVKMFLTCATCRAVANK